jgi:hypothetical protein
MTLVKREGSLWVPAHNGVGSMQAGFGAGVSLINQVAQTNPALWLDTQLGTLTPASPALHESVSAITDYNYQGRNLVTNPLHNSTQPSGLAQPTFEALLNNSPSFGLNANQNFIVGTAFGASTSHTFIFDYSPNSLVASLEWLFYSDTGGTILALATKLGAGPGVGTHLGFYDGAVKLFTQLLLTSINTYAITYDGVGGHASLYVNDPTVIVNTQPYTPTAIQSQNIWGSNPANTAGILGFTSKLLYYPVVVSSTTLKTAMNMVRSRSGTP